MIRNKTKIFGEPNDPNTVITNDDFLSNGGYMVVGTGNKGIKHYYSYGKNLTYLIDGEVKDLEFTTANAGQVLSINQDGNLEWMDKPAGIYESDTVNLIASWQQMIDNGYITVENNVVNAGPNVNMFNSLGFIDIVLDNNIIELGDNIFKNTNMIFNVKLPNNLKKIGNSTFDYCMNLVRADLPPMLQSIGDYAFRGTDIKEIIMPDTLTTLGAGAFDNCSYVTELRFSQNITTIPTLAFSGIKVQYIDIPEKVTTIGSQAFSYCDELVSPYIPAAVTKIEYSAFKSCSKLNQLFINATTPPVLGNDVFDGTNLSNGIIHVPYSSVDTYKKAAGWSEYADRISGWGNMGG